MKINTELSINFRRHKGDEWIIDVADQREWIIWRGNNLIILPEVHYLEFPGAYGSGEGGRWDYSKKGPVENLFNRQPNS